MEHSILQQCLIKQCDLWSTQILMTLIHYKTLQLEELEHHFQSSFSFYFCHGNDWIYDLVCRLLYLYDSSFATF